MMRAVPGLARLLGLAGLMPQAAALAILLGGPTDWQAGAVAVSVLYPALTMAFLGGCWWGIAAGAPAAERRRTLGWLWLAAVAPVLLALPITAGWALGLLAREGALVMLGAALLMSPAVDARAGALAPRWWLALRVPLSVGLGALTLATAFA